MYQIYSCTIITSTRPARSSIEGGRAVILLHYRVTPGLEIPLPEPEPETPVTRVVLTDQCDCEPDASTASTTVVEAA
jgi:hypothetical protein